jgi:ketosteroid isomerase-like protein
MTTISDIAEAFSAHRFEEAVGHLAADARWVLVGQATLEGRDAITAACRNTAAELSGSTTTFTRFLSVTGADAVAVDAVARYVDPAGGTSVVSSCDIYEFSGDTLTTITSYAVELPDE